MDKLHRRAEKAWTAATLHHSALREAYLWYMPERYFEMANEGREGNASRSAYDHMFDPTGMQALEDGANQIAEALHPWDQEWARWKPRADIPQDVVSDIEKAAEEITKKTTALIDRSNFDSAAPSAHREFLLGTGFLLITRSADDASRIEFQALPAYQWALEADAAGRVMGLFRKFKVKARDAKPTLPFGKFSPDAMTKAEGSPDDEIELCMAVTYIAGELPPGARRWTTCYYETVNKHEVWRQDSRTCPVVVYRASATAGIAWGRGPGLRALPDVKVANRLTELMLRAGAIDVIGIWQADDDGVLNPHNVRLVPGAIIPKAKGSDGLQAIKTGASYELSDSLIERLHANIRRAFFVTRIEERDMTAEEYRGRLQQQLRDQRGVYGLLKIEFAEQVMRRVLDLAVEMGELPDTTIEKMAQIELTGPLATDVRGLEVERFKQAFADIAAIEGPELAVASVNIEKLPQWIATRRYAPSELFRDEATLVKIGQQIQEMMVQQQAQQMMEGQLAA